MERFTRLYERIDATTSTSAKVEAMRAYFVDAPPEDAAWAVFFLSGRRLKRVIGPRTIAGWALERSGISEWLFGECYAAVGDLAEAIALVVPEPSPHAPHSEADSEPEADSEAEPDSEPGPEPDPGPDPEPSPDPSPDSEPEPDPEPSPEPVHAPTLVPLHRLAASIESLRDAAPDAQRRAVLALLDELRGTARMLAIKLLTGELRVGVSELLLTRALAAASGVPAPTLAHRLVGTFVPTADAYRALVSADGDVDRDPKKPYPFMLASPLDTEPSALGDPASLCIEWKWDGIRCQLVRRGGETYLWSRGEELVTERFPEIVDAARALPDGTVLDGEAMCWRGDAPLPFAILQQRIGRKRLTPRVLAAAPVVFVAYDVLELDHHDLRAHPLRDRRARLEALLVAPPPSLRLSPRITEPADWPGLTALRATSRERGVEGFMLKRWDAPYGVGRKRGDAWKWKIQPFTVDAVLVYAHPGHGRRSNLFTDYTFAVWESGALVPIARAYSGLDDAEIAELDRWIRAHVKERFGPVRAVDPTHVFELAFEGIAASTRHKAGLALRFPRIARWRRDKRPEDADRIEALRALIPGA